MKQRLQILALSTLALSASTGCSAFVNSTQSVSISATDPRAEIWVNGSRVGQGPVTMELARNRNHSFTAKVDDRAGVAQIGKQISGTGVLDIIGGVLFLVPFVGIATPGFWELEQTSLTIPVPPASATPAAEAPAEAAD